jgi:hypothetical protein
MRGIVRRLPVMAGCMSVAACGGDGHGVSHGSALGACTVEAPGELPVAGVAGYVEHVTPTVGNRFRVGSLGVTIVCTTGGAAGDQVVLVMPNLERGKGVPEGEYRIARPGVGSAGELADPRLAWARVQRGADLPLLFVADGGRLRVTRSADGLLKGAFQVAFAEADTPISLPGARPEAAAAAGVDSAGARVRAPGVLGGAFAAPRKEADWRGH